MIRRLMMTSAIVMSLCSVTSVQAYDCYGGGPGYGFGLGYLYSTLDFRVPYFAAHPPVYYSHPVPRTYGHSPFAYPPHFRTPEIAVEVQPMEIVNPYVPSSAAQPAAPTDQTTQSAAPKPLIVVNPYVTDTKVMNASHAL